MQSEMSQASWYVIDDQIVEPTNHRPRKESSSGSDGETEVVLSSITIPPNKGSKRYLMEEVFNVWYEHKDAVTALESPMRTSEHYMLARPAQIYHLDLQHSAGRNGEDISEEVKSLSVEPRKSALPPNLPLPAEKTQPELQSLVSPENIQWFYLDPSGNEQGPFTGEMMQEWLTDGYLTFDLRIRRSQETQFQALKQLCERVQNFVTPFRVPLPDLDAERFSPQASIQPSGGSTNGNMSNGLNQQGQQFGSNLYSQIMPNGSVLGAASMRLPSNNLFDFMGDYPLINQQNQFPSSQFGIDHQNLTNNISSGITQNLGGNMNQNMSSGITQNLGSNMSSNMGANHQNLGSNINPNLSFGLLHMPSLLQQQILQQQQPSLSRTNSAWGLEGGLINNQTPATAPPLAAMAQPGPMSPWLAGVQSVSRVSSPFMPSSSINGGSSVESNGAVVGDDLVLQDLHSSMVTGILGDEEHKEAEKSIKKAEVVAEPVEEFKEEIVESPVIAKEEVHESEKGSESSQPPLAPWAKAAAPVVESKQSLTLKQIQELEAERLRKEKQLRAEIKQEVAFANAVAASKEEKTSDKVTFNWANASQPVTAKKSLAEIQREEAEAAKSKSSTKASTSAVPKTSFASSLATSVPKEESVWTTVASKKTVPKKTTGLPVPIPAVGNKLSPQMLRAASATALTGSSINVNALKEDFLVWARSAMTNLYPSVSKSDLLEIFTTLPLHGADSVPLISETIYSSSATMDGRRFAQEFMKKRQQLEKQIGSDDSSSWSGAISSSADKIPTVDDDGWSTNVKSKKKGKKN